MSRSLSLPKRKAIKSAIHARSYKADTATVNQILNAARVTPEELRSELKRRLYFGGARR